MDSKSSTPEFSDDHEQWWQPGPPAMSAAEELSEGMRVLGNGLNGLMEAFTAPFRQLGKTRVSDELAERLQQAGNLLPPDLEIIPKFIEAASPIIEVMHGHWAVCRHKPKCKKPPAHTSLNPEAGKQRRGKLPAKPGR